MPIREPGYAEICPELDRTEQGRDQIQERQIDQNERPRLAFRSERLAIPPQIAGVCAGLANEPLGTGLPGRR